MTTTDAYPSELQDLITTTFSRADPVSYTHLDVYKRQVLVCRGGRGTGLMYHGP